MQAQHGESLRYWHHKARASRNEQLPKARAFENASAESASSQPPKTYNPIASYERPSACGVIPGALSASHKSKMSMVHMSGIDGSSSMIHMTLMHASKA